MFGKFRSSRETNMEPGMTTWMILLMVLAVVSLALVAGTALVLTYQLQIRLMRISSERLGIPARSMEPEKPPTVIVPKIDNRPRMHVPIPGGAMFKPSEPRKVS